MTCELEDWSACIMTPEQAIAELEGIEKQLGERLSLTGNIREQLIALNSANLLIEDELVADWHQAYAWYVEFMEHPYDD